MNKKKNRKKNRSLKDSNDPTSFKDKVLGNSPKRSNVEYKPMEMETVIRIEENPV